MNLITVPACRRCNEMWARDESYLADVTHALREGGAQAVAIEGAGEERLARIGRKIVFGTLIHELGAGLDISDIGPANISVYPLIPGAPWRMLEPDAITSAIAYCDRGFECTVCLRQVLWISAQRSSAGGE